MRCLTLLLCLTFASLAEPTAIELRNAEMAGISGFRRDWNRPIMIAEDGARRENAAEGNKHFGVNEVADWWQGKRPGAPAFDAIHRSLLVRFPGAAKRLAEAYAEGRRIAKVELVLPFVDTEYYPLHYTPPGGLSFHGKTWVKQKPRWHAVAWALRRPWQADPRRGPSFNHARSGRYGMAWERFGASGESDRFATRFGPAEVSHKVTEGALDITPLCTDETFGPTLGDRLRLLEQAGLLVQKWETYDMHFSKGGYEWSVCTGGRGIIVRKPFLRVTLAEAEAKQVALPKSAGSLHGKPAAPLTASLPDDAAIRRFIQRYGRHQPAGMPDWQWERLQELFAHARRSSGIAFPETVAAYKDWVDALLAEPYRRFSGHHTNMSTLLYHRYAPALPPIGKQHIRKNWETWLYPGVPYTELVHNLAKQIYGGSYIDPEADDAWRGRSSFFRESYTRYMSTQNFNYIASTGALLGGQIIDDPDALADGRYGLEYWPLRLWSWLDGSGQEAIDHYYLGLSMINQKNFAVFAERQFDRLMGRSGQLKNLDELMACYHPGLRHFIATSGRTGIPYLLAKNPGINCIIHLFSRSGALHDLNNQDLHGMKHFGRDAPPALIAEQALISPFGPSWMSQMVDSKPLPSTFMATDRQHGGHMDPPLTKVSYLGRHYGMASLDLGAGRTVPAMAQWRRDSAQVRRYQELGLLVSRFGVNHTNIVPPTGGLVGFNGGGAMHMQHKNKRISLFSPVAGLAHGQSARFPKAGITRIQGTAALFNFQHEPTWRFYVNGERRELPIRMDYGDRLAIHDGVSYLGFVPIPGTDLGRDVDIELAPDPRKGVKSHHSGTFRAQLHLNFYIYNRDKKFDVEGTDRQRLVNAYTGYVLEMGDASEWDSFDAFQEHLLAAELDTRWDPEAKVVHVDYRSGDDHLRLAAKPAYDPRSKRPLGEGFVHREANGRWPFLPPGIDRQGSYSQAGTAGLLEVNGARIIHEPGRMAYLLAEPVSGNSLFINPLPDPQYLSFRTPEGVRVEADGKLAITELTVNARDARVDLRYASRDDEYGGRMATALYLFGFDRMPRASRNGKPVGPLQLVQIGAQPAYVLPLHSDLPPVAAADRVARYRRHAARRQAALTTLGANEMTLRYEPGGEHYLSAQPKPGIYNLHRLWPNPSAFECRVPNGARLAIDGRIAMQRIRVDTKANAVRLDYPPYAQQRRVEGEWQPFEHHATSLLLFGFPERPAVNLHGTDYTGPLPAVELAGERAWLVPLFGANPADLTEGIAPRYRRAMELLE